MTINEIISHILENSKSDDGSRLTQVMLAKTISQKYGKNVTPAALNDRFKNENMKVNTAIEMLDILGYDLFVVPRNPQDNDYKVELGQKRER